MVNEALGSEASYEIVYAQINTEDNFENNKQDEGALVRKRPVLITPLNPRYTFDNFIVDEFNQFVFNLLLKLQNGQQHTTQYSYTAKLEWGRPT